MFFSTREYASCSWLSFFHMCDLMLPRDQTLPVQHFCGAYTHSIPAISIPCVHRWILTTFHPYRMSLTVLEKLTLLSKSSQDSVRIVGPLTAAHANYAGERLNKLSTTTFARCNDGSVYHSFKMVFSSSSEALSDARVAR